ncbi:MAG: hypothetical protein WCG87_08235 [Bacteroidota bacterium]
MNSYAIAIDTTNTICIAPNKGIMIHQTNDSLIINVAICNKSKRDVTDVNITVHYLIKSYGIYSKPHIDAGQVSTSLLSDQCYVINCGYATFDSHLYLENINQYILLIGTYNLNHKKYKIKLCYCLDPNIGIWKICSGQKDIENIYNHAKKFYLIKHVVE